MDSFTNQPFESELLNVLNYFEEASEELKRNNRFTNEKLDKVVEALVYANMNAEIIKCGSIMYRARKYTEPNAVNRFLNCDTQTFQGYDKKGSFVNTTADKEGRCNPQYIPYLYVSESQSCCIAEICPRIGDFVNVAEIRVTAPIKILRLATGAVVSKGEPTIIPNIPDSVIILYLAGLFSKRHEKDGDYLMTQYLSEKIKNASYGGISFYSSVYKGIDNVNYTIFDYEKCEAINSKLCKVTDISIEYTFDPNSYKEARDDWRSADAYEAFMRYYL